MRKQIIFRAIQAISLLFLVLPASATPMKCAYQFSSDMTQTYQCSSLQSYSKKVNNQLFETNERESAITMSVEQLDLLISLLQHHAKYRHEIKQTAYMALIKLHQLATENRFNHLEASQLTKAYGSALTDLAVLDTQMSSDLRAVLSPAQRKALQIIIEKSRLRNNPNL